MAADISQKKNGRWQKVSEEAAKSPAPAKGKKRMATRRTTRKKVDSKVRKAGIYAGKTAVSTSLGTVISHSKRKGKRKRASWLTFLGVLAGGVAEVFGDTNQTHIQMISAAGQGAAAAGLGDAIAERAIEAQDELIDDEEGFVDEIEDADPNYIESERRRVQMAPQTRYSEDTGV